MPSSICFPVSRSLERAPWARKRIGLSIVLVSLLASISVPTQAAIPAAERDALLNLYIYTHGDGWADVSGWKGAPGTECTWYGITCDATGRTVTAIDLSGNLLHGTLPSISALTNLQSFNVGGSEHFLNLLVGQLPSLSGLTQLRTFIANNQQFTGPIPTLQGLTNLSWFQVSNNRLSGAIPALNGLTNLAHFDVNTNRLTGTIPDLTGLANLDYFRITGNWLEGTLPALNAFTKLTWFDASGNNFVGSIPAVAGLNNLQIFGVAGNQLTGNVPELTGLANLQYFAVSANHLTGNIPDLGDLKSLTTFFVSANQLSGAVPPAPATIPNYDAALCPNPLIPASNPPSAIDVGWNAATGVTPWSLKCSQTPQVTETSVRSNLTPSSTPGQAVTFTATVWGLNPTGTVTFTSTMPLHDGTTLLCDAVPLIGTVATCTTTVLTAQSSNVVQASYSGDANNAPSSDASVDQVVVLDLTETASTMTPQIGQAVDLVARLVGANPTDVVTFYDGVAALCSNVPLTPSGDRFVAHCVTTFSQAGAHSLWAEDVNAVWADAPIPIIVNVVGAQAFDANQLALTGSWYNAATSGQGLTIQIYPDFVSSGVALLGGGWFTYDNAGNQRWLYLQGSMTSAHGATLDLGVYASSGGNFDAPPVTTAVNYGTATLTFYDCSNAALSFTFLDGRSGTIPYTRLTSSTGCTTAVPATVPQSLPPNYSDVLHSGNWYSPATSGQGLVIDIVPAQNAFVATWYTYAPQAKGLAGEAAQRWFSIQSPYTPGNLNLTGLPIFATQGGIFNNSTPINFSPVGTADLIFTSCGAMSLHYAFTQGEFAGLSGTIAEQRLGPVAGCE